MFPPEQFSLDKYSQSVALDEHQWCREFSRRSVAYVRARWGGLDGPPYVGGGMEDYVDILESPIDCTPAEPNPLEFSVPKLAKAVYPETLLRAVLNVMRQFGATHHFEVFRAMQGVLKPLEEGEGEGEGERWRHLLGLGPELEPVALFIELFNQLEESSSEMYSGPELTADAGYNYLSNIPSNSLSGERGGLETLIVDFRRPLSVLKADFEKEVKRIKRERYSAVKAKSESVSFVLARWRKNKILEYLDLYYSAEILGLEPSYQHYADALFECDGTNDPGKIRQTVKPEAMAVEKNYNEILGRAMLYDSDEY